MPDEKTKQKIERLSREEASKLREEAREKRAKRQRDERNRWER